MNLKVTEEAPSNIALIKYMGKSNQEVNMPANASLSFCLPNLKSKVSIEESEVKNISWSSGTFESSEPNNSSHFNGNGPYSISLSDEGKNKFLAHWTRCQKRLAPNFNGGVVITSGNNFPSDCGLASSASSFAALTLASYQFFFKMDALEREWSREDLALLSKEGSGSSCRSFFGPWVLWSGNSVKTIEKTEWSDLLHTAVIIDQGKKKVSSSEAHRRIGTSSLFEGRIERANKRCEQMEKILQKNDSWSSLFELAWSEFWDMHLLFETSRPSFYYLSPKSLFTLRFLQDEWEKKGDGPIVTMDAGPNIHLLYRKNQIDLQAEQSEQFKKMDLMTVSGCS